MPITEIHNILEEYQEYEHFENKIRVSDPSTLDKYCNPNVHGSIGFANIFSSYTHKYKMC